MKVTSQWKVQGVLGRATLVLREGEQGPRWQAERQCEAGWEMHLGGSCCALSETAGSVRDFQQNSHMV